MSGNRPEDVREGPEIPAGSVALCVCVRCGRQLGWGPGKATPGTRIGGSKFSSPLERYCCADCLRDPRRYWR